MLIVATGDIVTFAVLPVVPVMTGSLAIDDTERTIIKLLPTPSAGTVAAWRAFCAA